MANNEESSPLLANQPEVKDEKKPMKPSPTAAAPPPAAKKSPPPFIADPQATDISVCVVWTLKKSWNIIDCFGVLLLMLVNALELARIKLVVEDKHVYIRENKLKGPISGKQDLKRYSHASSVFLPQTDSHGLFVGLLGSVAPCMLYASTAERIGSGPGTFANHCLTYSGLFLIGNLVFGENCLAPWFSYRSRTAIRRRFNLEATTVVAGIWLCLCLGFVFQNMETQGSCEALSRSCGCCGSLIEDELQREQCESACDLATHIFCHTCALCQEGREVRRRLPHPGFNAQPVLVMLPPGEQKMGRCGPEYSASA
ncbi:hypothetical protein RJ640_007215 [Escallonia rubra]|uniref:PLAC8 family protein n=1 Tax=Escallonia rubra TaxID=112253 RepID=A0AA88UAP4_9ASTE|nr:hypothetical protein RJ640_007215 [Escallonia rubra]